MGVLVAVMEKVRVQKRRFDREAVMKKTLILYLVLLSLFGLSVVAQAVPIDYYITGYGFGYYEDASGRYGLDKLAVEFIVSSDTSYVTSDGKGGYFSTSLSSSISIDNIGLFNLKLAPDLRLIQFYNSLTIYDKEKLKFSVYAENFDTYNLQTSFGPEPAKGAFYEYQFSTDDGGWLFFKEFDVTQFRAEINPVPEPSTFLLLAGGLACLGFARKRSGKCSK